MPPRGSEGYDFTPILTHYLFLFTTILSIAGWFTAFIGQAVATADGGKRIVGAQWFAIFLQLFLIIGVLHTLASDAIAMHRFQISVFGAVAIVFAVRGVDQGIYDGQGSLQAMAAGWLILAIVDILWVLYFTSEEDSLQLHIFNSMGTGGLTPPNRRRRGRGQSLHMGGNGYGGGVVGGGYSGGGIGPGDIPYDTKLNAPPMGGAMSTRSQGSVGAGTGIGSGIGVGGGVGGGLGVSGISNGGGTGSITGISASGQLGVENVGASSPLMGSGNAGVGAGGGNSGVGGLGSERSNMSETPVTSEVVYKAKALYAYSASADDPNEISFSKGEVLDIIDKNGKWWQAKKADGTVGIAPSNYLQIV